MKSLRIRSYSGPYFPAFRNNNQLICENCNNNHPQKIILKFVNFYLNRNLKWRMYCETLTAQKMKFFIIDFFSKCDKTRRKLRIWSHLLKKSLMKKIFFCVAPHCDYCCIKNLFQFSKNWNNIEFNILISYWDALSSLIIW